MRAVSAAPGVPIWARTGCRGPTDMAPAGRRRAPPPAVGFARERGAGNTVGRRHLLQNFLWQNERGRSAADGGFPGGEVGALTTPSR